MNLINKKLRFVFSTMLFAFTLVLVSPFSVVADTDKPEEEPAFRFADEVLLNFFDSNQQISALQRETQEKIAETVAQQGLTLERFNQIANAARIGALQGGTFTDDEVNAFNILGPQVSSIQRDQQGAMTLLLQERGFTTESYQEVLNEYRRDQNLQAHVRDLLRERRRQEILEERRREAEERANQENG
ncbi:MAG: DUF4168 domain-containing protein [Bacteroidales bacterium]